MGDKAEISNSVYTGKGILDQIHDVNVTPYFYKGQFPFDIVEVGDYSMIVKGDYPDRYKISDVRGIKVIESISTPEGTILYFSDKLPDGLKDYNIIYVDMVRKFDTSYLESIFTYPKLKLEKLIDNYIQHKLNI